MDLDLALEQILVEAGGERFGVAGVYRAHVDSLGEFLLQSHMNFDVGPVGYTRMATGPDTERRVVAFGIALLEIDGVKLAWLPRTANRHYGREQYALEVLSPSLAAADELLKRVRD